MATLNLFKERAVHTITLGVDGKAKDFKLPMEYTVEEAERVQELQVQIDKQSKVKVTEGTSEAVKQEIIFWDYVFSQLLVLFNRYQPDLKLPDLKKILTRDESTQIIKFFIENRLGSMTVPEKADKKGKKKIAKKSSKS